MSGSGSTSDHLDIGGVFDRTGEIYQSAFGTFWLVALVLLVPAAVIQWILGGAPGRVAGVRRILRRADRGVRADEAADRSAIQSARMTRLHE